ncbi:hypothetical protein Tco_1093282 [Tanacetum coccineum]|uniref:Uncharacterized protein n=1 Tax=Tanacetum coccineum TaxID=301880 RepID=A0ABQ5IC82_9ASTR
MKNGAWTPMHFARFSAVRQYENHRLFSKENGLDPRDMVTRTEFVRLLMESGTVDPFEITQNFIKKQTEEARKNNTQQQEKEASYSTIQVSKQLAASSQAAKASPQELEPTQVIDDT